MVKTKAVREFRRLSVPERILLLEDLWDDVTATEEDVPIPESHKKELDRRLKKYPLNSRFWSSWEDVKKRILRSAK
ncbi:MAG: hypothetical protein A2487_06355 [Candidatus Raymondbacteria bacterium RifOxyC12_full_50_8]|uniref:Addiction module protein n=1 Tax=Candidatus Raymondbacteria bacterium RIFOXYD12_FULL_49_13 TaxID=1817890 RepID=A0A1F7FC39_UNCRA|nr:MAG: hypothetical protein A2248_03255 [Candidatus Raymondbacteria bacterium RIFOXYA2_FULL_49_16]OGJ93284.1 MAG: hypothetical protein A2350_14540 [Candidatus Raymondbacteria bacterium RifOxyB12_full_50_8]OGK04244.1 MAG: hypothetical protein A2519_17950 [Candidatus Raymondbacteria bacterium RIFOXYD12_FULL_49_13]OGK06069.1 MAG: hypothetical protein A2487_06355 [Candidatus Raymondbacteria bacterium RifOxyC12_full_50_8]OGP42473.1 MAG: hypothetical protein A2324_17290 [Candidatus Raymondbacteria b